MNQFSEFLNQNLLSVVVVLSFLVLIFLVFSIFSFLEVSKLKKRYEIFTGGKRHSEYTMETQFKLFHQEAQRLEEKYESLAGLVRDMDKSINGSIQKIGVVRYNPFDEVGGNLCYAVALLDSNDNGVVLNGIHSRSGCFTYAKEIQLGVSKYYLSEEEAEALQKAIDNAPSTGRDINALDLIDEKYPRAYGEASKDYLPDDESLSLDKILQNDKGSVMTE